MPLSLRSFSTVADANAALKAGGARYLGGGTLVVRAANEGDLTTDTFVRSTDPRLSEISIDGEAVKIGASVTMATIARHKDLAPLAKAARSVGGPAIRNMATVGGNLFAPAPYGDFAVMLVALGATAELEGRSVPVEQLVADSVQGVVTAVRLDLPAVADIRFAKVSRTKPKGVSVLSIAAVIETAADGTVSSARIGLGCMAEHPMRARAAEAALVGARLTAEGVANSVAAIGEGTSPITDPIASAWYRSEVLPVHFRRLLIG